MRWSYMCKLSGNPCISTKAGPLPEKSRTYRLPRSSWTRCSVKAGKAASRDSVMIFDSKSVEDGRTPLRFPSTLDIRGIRDQLWGYETICARVSHVKHSRLVGSGTLFDRESCADDRCGVVASLQGSFQHPAA